MRVLILAALALPLAACGTLNGGGETNTQLLQNLRHCQRDYIGAIGGLMAPSASVSIHCPAEPYEPAKQAEPAS